MGAVTFQNANEKGAAETKTSGSKQALSNPQKDGTEAWVVALAACWINFIMAGLTRMSGLLFVAFISSFGVERREAAMPFSVRSSTRNLLGPLIGILGQKYGARAVILTGGGVATLSAASCFFATNITWMTILWGGLNGLGVSLIVILPQVVIGQYFDKYMTTASGMAFSGGCIGAFIFPVILERLLPDYGVEGTFLIISGIIMNTVPAAMILKRPSWLRTQKDQVDDVESAMTPVKSPPEYETPKLDKSKQVYKNEWAWNTPSEIDTVARFAKDGPSVQFLRQNRGLVSQILTKVKTGNKNIDKYRIYDDGTVSKVELDIWSELEDLFRYIQLSNGKSHFQQNLALADKSSSNIRKGNCKPLFKTKIQALTSSLLTVPSGGLVKSKSVPELLNIIEEFPKNFALSKLKSLHSMRLSDVLELFPKANKRSVSKVSRELRKLHNVTSRISNQESTPTKLLAVSKPTPTKKNDSDDKGSTWHLVKTAVLLHKDIRFILICICRVIHFAGYMPLLTIVVDFVKDKGLEQEDGKFAIAALSFGDLIGRLCLGFVTDGGYVNLITYIMLTMILQGASTASLPLMHTRMLLFPVLALTGLLEGSLFVRHPVLVSQYMEPSVQSIAMGCMNFFSGIFGLGIPLYIGFFRDQHGSYDYVFYINGFLGVVVGLTWLFEPYFKGSSLKKQSA